MSNLRRRLDRLAATAPPACPDAFHVTWHVVHEDAATGELPPPPVCPTCGSAPEKTIIVAYERVSPALDGGIELRRTSLTWRED